MVVLIKTEVYNRINFLFSIVSFGFNGNIFSCFPGGSFWKITQQSLVYKSFIFLFLFICYSNDEAVDLYGDSPDALQTTVSRGELSGGGILNGGYYYVTMTELNFFEESKIISSDVTVWSWIIESYVQIELKFIYYIMMILISVVICVFKV